MHFFKIATRFIYRKEEVNKLIILNIFMFMLINIASFIFAKLNTEYNILSNLGLSANLDVLIKKPWTIITYMFIQEDLIHICLNIILLYCGGVMFMKYFNKHKLWQVYIIGGIIGAISYIISFNIFTVFLELKSNSLAIGASASIFSILIACITYTPNQKIPTFIFGNVKLKYLGIFIIIVDLLSIPYGNPGGHIAHIGGAIYGFVFSKIQLKGNKQYIYRRYENDYEYNSRKQDEEKQLNTILEKISNSGYESLNKEEKEILLKHSNS